MEMKFHSTQVSKAVRVVNLQFNIIYASWKTDYDGCQSCPIQTLFIHFLDKYLNFTAVKVKINNSNTFRAQKEMYHHFVL